MIRKSLLLQLVTSLALAPTLFAQNTPSSVGDPALRTELLERMAADQRLRERLNTLLSDPSKADEQMRVMHEVEAVDSANTARVRAILATGGWQGRSKVGADGAQAFWLLVQHADADPAFQRVALTHLERAVAAGDAAPREMALLTDRVLLAEGKAQRYGTQLHRVGGRLVPRPIADSANVDARRASVGLAPLGQPQASGRGASEPPAPKLLNGARWAAAGNGLEIATLDGDPAVADQPFTLLLRLADGAWIPPHTHNIAKRLLVIRGTLLVGHGERIDSARVELMPAGSFLVMPADHAHYEGGRGETVVALYGIGPLRTNLLTPPAR